VLIASYLSNTEERKMKRGEVVRMEVREVVPTPSVLAKTLFYFVFSSTPFLCIYFPKSYYRHCLNVSCSNHLRNYMIKGVKEKYGKEKNK
jgi:hypothetical protein